MNLLAELNNLIFPTNLTRKLTINGETKAYPVYKINISALYYNDQNDRIASWISQYKEEHGSDSLSTMDKSECNDIIEHFIVSSNPASIDKTAMNIKLVGQREPGVVLNDGRVIDGNRRFTCIRKLNKNNPQYVWFEAVILDMDINNSKKMIKMLELTIQHGEEKRVDYNHVEMLIGVYQDIVETKLLTVEEYAQSTNESISEIKRKVAGSKILAEYLEYIGMPKQYYIAREFQLVSLISDVHDVLKKCTSLEMAENLKRIIFLNQMMNSIGDERRFTKNIATMISNGQYYSYESAQLKIEEKVNNRRKLYSISSFSELKSFVAENDDLTDELKESMTFFLNNSKLIEVHNKPSQMVTKTLVSLKDIDTNVVTKLTSAEKNKLTNQLQHLTAVINEINMAAGGMNASLNPTNNVKDDFDFEKDINKPKKFTILPSFGDEQICIKESSKTISGLIFTLDIKTSGISDEYHLFFVDCDNQIISNDVKVSLNEDFNKIQFELLPKVGESSSVNLAIQKVTDKEDELRFLFAFHLDVGFGGDFDF